MPTPLCGIAVQFTQIEHELIVIMFALVLQCDRRTITLSARLCLQHLTVIVIDGTTVTTNSQTVVISHINLRKLSNDIVCGVLR